MTSIDTRTVHSISSERSGGLENDGSAQGFDNQIKAAAVVALALVVLVRPRELNFLRLLPFILPLFLTSLYLASRTVAGLRSVWVPFSVVVMVFWFVTTTAWSVARTFSAAESIVIICVAGMASLVASFCSLRALIGGVMVGCLAVLVMSIAVGAAFPAYGLVSDPYEGGSLQGIMLDRNSLAFVLLLGLVATLAFEFRGRWARMHKIIIGAFLFGGVLSAKSATCLILAVVAILMAVALALPRRVAPARRGWALAAVTLPIAATIPYLTAHLDQLYELVGRDSTLTGRTQIWPAVRQVIAIQPWLGQGWGAVWAPVPLHRLINRSVGFEVPHSHNGYLTRKCRSGR